MTKERTKVETQTMLIHLMDNADKKNLEKVFDAAADWFNERGDLEMMHQASDLRDYVKNEISEPVGKVLSTER